MTRSAEPKIHLDLRLAKEWIEGRTLESVGFYQSMVYLGFDDSVTVQAYSRLDVNESAAWDRGQLFSEFVDINRALGELAIRVTSEEGKFLSIDFSNLIRVTIQAIDNGFEWVHVIRPDEEIVCT